MYQVTGSGGDGQFWGDFFELLYQSGSPGLADQAFVQDWLNFAEPKMQVWDRAVFRAIIGGFYADRVAYAFLAGYQSALRHRFTDLPQRGLVAFCVSEKGGAKPTAFKTSGVLHKDGVCLNGKKTFVTCGEQADLLLVAYRGGEQASGLPLINIAKVVSNASGLTIKDMPEMPFIPELRRGSVLLEDVIVEERDVYSGDGYLNFAKPFSASEGYFIMASVIAYLLRIARQCEWPINHVDELVSLLQFTVELTGCDPLDPKTIIAGNGVRQSLQSLTEKTKPLWQSASDVEQQRWMRDGAILFASDKSQQARLNKARAYYNLE